jgi:signal transduction histidine kinase
MDVVVLDIRMPGMDGHGIHERIRAQYPDTEVIFLTGHGSTADGVAGIKAGAFDYLTKPLEFDHLHKKIIQAREKKDREAERKKEATLRTAMEKKLAAAERLADLGVLASGVAHEINNPLAIIHNWSELLGSLLRETDEEFSEREEFERGFEKIDLAVKRAKQITAKMLGAIQKRTEQPSDISPSELLEQTLKLVREAAEKKHVSILVLPVRETVVFRADPYPVQQVLLNVVNNAIDAAPEGGGITCRIVMEEDRFVAFRVEDSGEGIPPDILGKIFDPFFTTKPAGEGAGLGLYVSRKIVEKLGGAIDAANMPGRGAVLTVRFPLSPL